MAVTAMQQADASRYPDPTYTDLRAALAQFHGVAPERLVLAASASEAIYRLSAWLVRCGGGRVSVPEHAYGDYAHAAHTWGLQVVQRTAANPAPPADLHWYCDPSSPTGQNAPAPAHLPVGTVVLDRAYHPLRLHIDGNNGQHDHCGWLPEVLDTVWQLWSPNKALGLTGVRAAYLIAPLGAGRAVQALTALAPSWPIGTHGVALLQAWCQPACQIWLASSLHTLRRYKATQIDLCQQQGWVVLPSEANFFCVQVPRALMPEAATEYGPTLLGRLRAQGIKVRDCNSFGLPGHLRLGVLAPVAQQALRAVLGATAHAGQNRRNPPSAMRSAS